MIIGKLRSTSKGAIAPSDRRRIIAPIMIRTSPKVTPLRLAGVAGIVEGSATVVMICGFVGSKVFDYKTAQSIAFG
jgi:hypothetical protein